MKYPSWVLPLTIGTSFLITLGAVCGGSTGADGGVFKSVDQGQTWEQKVYAGESGRRTLTIASLNTTLLMQDPSNPQNLFLGTEETGLWYSGNFGEQWGQIQALSTGKVRGVVFDPLTPTTIFVLRDNQIARSTDSGTSWEVVYTETSGRVVVNMGIHPNSPNILFAGIENGKVIRSTDGGVNWSVALSESRKPMTRVIINPSSPEIIYALELEENLWRSTDGGTTWIPLYTNDHILQVRGTGEMQRLAMASQSPSTIYLIAENVGLIRSDDNGENWQQVNTLVGRDVTQITSFQVDPNDSDILWMGVGHFIHVSYDRGSTWNVIETFPSSRQIVFFAFDSQDPKTMFAGTRAVPDEGGLLSPK